MGREDTARGYILAASSEVLQCNWREHTMDEQQGRIPGRYGSDEIEESQLEIWPNAHAERDYIIHLEIPEFTCLCPRSGFPDFATITVDFAEQATPTYQGPRPDYRRYLPPAGL